MHIRPALIAALLLPAAATAQTTNCGSAQTQMAANQCAATAARAADAALNAAWSRVRAALKGGEAEAPLLQAQRAWIAYRDAACQSEAAVYAGGSIMPMIASSCVERLTRVRTQDLQNMLN